MLLNFVYKNNPTYLSIHHFL